VCLHSALVRRVGQAGRVDIAELARRAQIAIGNDTGPIHIAGTVGCPAIGLFSGKTDPNKSKPLGARVVALQEQDIAAIAPETVCEAINGLLSPTAGEGAVK